MLRTTVINSLGPLGGRRCTGTRHRAEPGLGLRLQRRADPAGGGRAAEPELRRGGHGLLLGVGRLELAQAPPVPGLSMPRTAVPASASSGFDEAVLHVGGLMG